MVSWMNLIQRFPFALFDKTLCLLRYSKDFCTAFIIKAINLEHFYGWLWSKTAWLSLWKVNDYGVNFSNAISALTLTLVSTVVTHCCGWDPYKQELWWLMWVLGMTENKETKTQSKTQIPEMQCNQTLKKLHLNPSSLSCFQIKNYLFF